MVNTLMAKHQKDVDKYEAKIDKLKTKISDLKEKLEAVLVLSQHTMSPDEP